MKTIRNLFLISLCASFAACTNETFVEEPAIVEGGSNTTIKEITVNLPEILNDADTRTTFTMTVDGVTASWAENDTIGIFPNQGGQVEFPTVSGAGSNTAKFNGGGWGLKNANTYSAYYPYNKANIYRDNKHILLDYTGQTQVGNDNADHLGAYDYLASGAVSPHNGYLNLDMQRLGSIVKLELDCSYWPFRDNVSGTFFLSSDVPLITKAELDISGTTPVVTPIETSNVLPFYVKDIRTPDNHNYSAPLTVYLMLYPVNLSEGNLSISHSIFYTHDGAYSYSLGTYYLDSKNLEAGKPYSLSGDFIKPTNYVYFDDELALQICLQNWDTDRDGVLSRDEAAAVSSIGSVFAGTEITSLPLSFFTGLTAIEDGAFKNCTNLGYINLPSGITTIGNNAFENCKTLFNISLRDGLQSIGDYAFAYSGLSKINIPESVSSIGKRAFEGCRYISEVTIPEGVSVIEEGIFCKCINLSKVSLSGCITSIPDYAFYGCSSLVVFNMPNNLNTIGGYAYYGCSSYNADIPDGVTNIGEMAFYGCYSLDTNIPSSLISIGDYAFLNCSSMTSIAIPESCTSFGDFIFQNCNNIKNVSLPSTLENVPVGLFANCNSLKTIDFLPEGLLSIRESAFSSCLGITSVTLPESLELIGAFAFSDCRKLVSISIPDNVVTIDNGAFINQSLLNEAFIGDLNEVFIGNGVTFIGNSAFRGNNNLEKITISAIIPPIITSSSFTYTNECPIYVPAESVDAYKEAWGAYADRIFAINSGGGVSTTE